MKTVFLTIPFILLCPLAQLPAQPISCSLTQTIDTVTNGDPNIKKVYDCWAGYLASSPDSLYDNPYWNSADKIRYKSYDLLKSEGFLSPGLYAFGFLKNQVLSIANMGDAYIIRSRFYYIYPENSKLFVMAITNTIAKQDADGNFKLHNWLHHYTRAWNTRKVGVITYYYYPGYPFNIFEAEKANKMIDYLKKIFDMKREQEIAYYIASDCDGIMKLKGFEYVVGMGDNITNLCGFHDVYNTIIYSNSKKGEYYEHEITRLINNFFPRAHGHYINGLTKYFTEDDMALGQSFKRHFQRMDDYLEAHEGIDLSNYSDSFYAQPMDNITPPHYFVGLLICRLTLDKGGLPLLKQAMNSTPTNEDMLRFIEEELHIKRKDLNRKLRQLIHQYAQEDFKRMITFE
jgi:hypothetical protein